MFSIIVLRTTFCRQIDKQELKMEPNLGYDFDEAIKRLDISMAEIENLRNLSLDFAPTTITNKQLALFLYSCGGVNSGRNVLETYYEALDNAPEHFTNRDPQSNEIQQCLDNQHYFHLPPTPSGHPIVFHRLANSKPSNYHFDHAIKTFFMTIDACLYKYGPRPGYIFVFDMNDVRLSHLLRVRISSIKKFFHYLQDCVPGKLYQIHVLNVVSFFDKILSLIKPFMNAEIFKLLYTHPPNTNMEEFYKQWIPRECLPSDFGGAHPSIAELHNDFRSEIMELRDYFLAEENQRKQRNGHRKDYNKNITKGNSLNID